MFERVMRWLGYIPYVPPSEQKLPAEMLNGLPTQQPAPPSKLDKLAAMIVEGIKFEATNPNLGPLPNVMNVNFVAAQFTESDGDNALLKVLEAKGGELTIKLKLMYAVQEPQTPVVANRPPLPVGMVGSVVEGGL